MLVWLILALLVAVYVYVEFSPADVDKHHISEQASLAKMRAPGESAVYRSLVNPHGRALAGQQLRNFTIAGAWEPQSFRIAHAPASGVVSPVKTFEADVYRLGNALKAHGSIFLSTLTSSPDALKLVFACNLFGFELTLVEDSELSEAKQLVQSDFIVTEETLSQLTDGTADASPPDKVTAPLNAVSFIINNRVYNYSQQEVGVAIVSQMSALGHRGWSQKDRVVVFTTIQSPYTLLLQLVALSCKAELLFVDAHTVADPFELLSKLDPTIIATDDFTLQSLVRCMDDFGPAQWLYYGFAYLRLARGCLLPALLKAFKHVRYVHSAVLEDVMLTDGDINSARIITGAQVAHALTVPQCFIPLAQTSFGDYRSSESVVSFGPPVPGIELKTAGPDSASGKGKLWYKYSEWNDSGLEAKLFGDGCVGIIS